MEGKNNTTAFCFLLPCFGLFFYLLFFPFPFPFPSCFWFSLRPCVFAPLRSLLQPFPFEPLRSRSRSRVSFLWMNRKSEGFGEAVQGVGCRSGIDGMGRLSIAEDFAQTSDIRIGDLGRIAG